MSPRLLRLRPLGPAALLAALLMGGLLVVVQPARRPVQREALEAIDAGRNVLVSAPTGSRDANAPLTMGATARTYRYLDSAEVAEQRRAATKAGGKK